MRPGRVGRRPCQTAQDGKRPGAWALRPTAGGRLSRRECWSLTVSRLASSQGRRAAGRGASSHAATGTGGAAPRPARPSARAACTGRCSAATSAETHGLAPEDFTSAHRRAWCWGPLLFSEGSPKFQVVPGLSVGPRAAPTGPAQTEGLRQSQVSRRGAPACPRRGPRPGCHTALPRAHLWAPPSGLGHPQGELSRSPLRQRPQSAPAFVKLC